MRSVAKQSTLLNCSRRIDPNNAGARMKSLAKMADELKRGRKFQHGNVDWRRRQKQAVDRRCKKVANVRRQFDDAPLEIVSERLGFAIPVYTQKLIKLIFD